MVSFPEDLLRSLCAESGIETEYWDIWGNHHLTPSHTILPILKSLGYDTSSPEALRRSAAERRQTAASRLVDPVLILCQSDPDPVLLLRLPTGRSRGATASLAIYWETGPPQRADFRLDELPRKAALQVETASYDVFMLPLPAPIPLGYHDLEAAVRSEDGTVTRATMRLIVAPQRAWQPPVLRNGSRLAGLAVSLYGVRSGRNWGAGDFTDLKSLLAWVANDLGASFLALNPLHALHNRQPYNTSPYLPLSSFYRNALYIDVAAVEDFQRSRAAQRLARHPKFQAELKALRSADLVAYERVIRLKMLGLRLAFRRFCQQELAADTERAKEFRRFVAVEGELLSDFATYLAIDEWLHRKNPDLWVWPDWPSEYRDPRSEEVRRFAAQHRRQIQFFQYVQWQIDRQLGEAQKEAERLGMAVGLYHDLALATDRCGADLWAHRQFFVDGCRVGSPPDDFAPEGQDWAFPPPNSHAHRLDGYRLFVESIRKNSKHGGALRIDHVMRFFRLFWIPDGHPAREGTYVNEPWEDLLRILALESVRGRFLIVGEDLGTVPPPLREAMERFGMLSYKLFWFEKGSDGMPKPCREYASQALVSSTTHDLPTLAGFWAGRDIDARRAAGLIPNDESYHQQRRERAAEKRRMVEALIRDGFLPPETPREVAEWSELTGELHNAVIGYLVSTPCRLMLLNQEDLTKETEQQNLPGTTWQYPNWQRKMRLSLEELPAAHDFARMFRNWLERTGRLNPGPARS